jgi:hypothetical protein
LPPQVLIYVFDVASATDAKDTEYFVSCLEAIHQVAPAPPAARRAPGRGTARR